MTDTHRKIGAGGDVGNAGTCPLIRLAGNECITLQIRNNDGTGDALIHKAVLTLIRQGD
jgi:hypothetical protein